MTDPPSSKEKPFGQWSRRELIARVRGLDVAHDESTFVVELLVAAGFVSREKVEEARSIVRSWDHKPPANTIEEGALWIA